MIKQENNRVKLGKNTLKMFVNKNATTPAVQAVESLCLLIFLARERFLIFNSNYNKLKKITCFITNLSICR